MYDPKAKPSLSYTSVNALPPWHSVAFVVSVMTLCIHQARSSLDSLASVATLETFTHRVFPRHLSVLQLGWIRAGIAVSIWVTFVSTLTSDGWVQITTYKPGSKLKSGVHLHMKGTKTLFPFTSWCWILLGISYTNHALLALAVAYYGEEWTVQYLNDKSPWILRLVLLLWETAAPCAFLVSSVIRYAIWDRLLHGKNTSTKHLKHPRNIMSHNMNSVFVLTEIALLGGVPIRMSDMYLGALYGSIYVCIAWSLTHFWAPEHGPHFIYFFLDTTLGLPTTIALMALTTTLCLFYVLLSYAKLGLESMTPFFIFQQSSSSPNEEETSFGLLILHVVFVLGIASSVCRFRD